jgi:hypothetical protein
MLRLWVHVGIIMNPGSPSLRVLPNGNIRVMLRCSFFLPHLTTFVYNL